MTLRKVFYLLLTLAAILIVPYLGAYFCYNGDIEGAKPGYFDFPPGKVDKAPANNVALIICAVIFIAVLLLYFVPKLFGFKKNVAADAVGITKHKFPIWFWIGLFVWSGTLILWICKVSEPKWFLDWSFIPLCWGFILFLDGLVYYFNHGESMMSKKPTELIALGIVSISGWLIFEYLNVFIEHNWHYPKADLRSHDGFIIYATFGSSAFIPMAFEWYQLIRKLKVFETRYKFGPKVSFPTWFKIFLLVVCFAGLFITPFYPEGLFSIVWIVPVIIMALVLSMLGIWTPFTPIKISGDWTYLLVFALTFLIQGFLLEWWNYLGATKLDTGEIISYNASYWQYCVPFVSKYHIFEMPFFGYMGYLLFSIHCSLWWITLSHLMEFSTSFSARKDFR